MKFFGIQEGKDCIKLACISKRWGKAKIIYTQTISKNSNVKEFYISKSNLCSGLDFNEVFIKKYETDLHKRSDILANLALRLEDLIPCDKDNLVVYPYLHKSRQSTEVYFLATTKDDIKKHLENLNSQNIYPNQLSTNITALSKTFNFFFPKLDSCIIFHSEKDRYFFILVEKSKPIFCKSFTASKDLFIERFEQELAVFQSFIEKRLHEGLKKAILLTGDLREKNKIIPKIGCFFEILELNEDYATYAISIGLALEASRNNSVQFLHKSFSNKNQLELKKTSILCFTSLAILCCSFLIFDFTKTSQILKQANNLNIKTLNLKDLEQKISSLEKINPKKPSNFYIIDVPKVSDILLWLSNNEILKNEDKLEVKKFDYRLISYPTLKNKDSPYEVFVELEFTASSPKAAKNFHDAMLKGLGPMDKDKKISWDFEDNLYKTSFFIKKL